MFQKRGMALICAIFSLILTTLSHGAQKSEAPVTPDSQGPLHVKVDSTYTWDNPIYHDKASEVLFWLESSMARVYPNSPPAGKRAIELLTARNARLSFQACLRNDRSGPFDVQCEVVGADGLDVQVRRVGWALQTNMTADIAPKYLDGIGYVPGLVPDPLFPEPKALVGPFSNQSFWISLRIPADAAPGPRTLQVVFRSPSMREPVRLKAVVDIRKLVIEKRHNFPVTHWWNADAIYDWYKYKPFDDNWFKIVRPYLQDMLDHGSNVILVPMFYTRREIVERPAQMLGVTEVQPGRYEFDWSKVRRFVKMAKEMGFEHFEWPHFWCYKVDATEFSVETPTRMYTWKDGRAQLLWPLKTPGTGEVYRNFLTQFMPEFHRLLVEEKLLDKSIFHLSDEPGGTPQDFANYRAARNLLAELAPWMKVMDALSDIRYATGKGLCDVACPNVQVADTFNQAGVPSWVYYCCGPRGPYLNHFFDTPLSTIRMSGWLFYRHQAMGFLHWGYNYWYVMDLSFNEKTQVLVDPFLDGANPSAGGAGSPFGDHFVVYPGPKGPIDSIRWEVFADSLQDYALLQTLGIKPGDPLLSPLKGYGDFPRDEAWIQQSLRRLLK